MKPFNYSGRMVIGVKAMHEKRMADLARVRKMEFGPKGGKSAWHGYNGDNPYHEKWGVVEGEKKLKEVLGKKWVLRKMPLLAT